MTASSLLANNLLIVLSGVLALWIYCLVDFNRTDERYVRVFDRRMWVVLLVCFDVVGGLLWLAIGRPRRASGR